MSEQSQPVGMTRNIQVVREVTQSPNKVELKIATETLVFVDGKLVEVRGGPTKTMTIVGVAGF